jgi:hypothetical protein
VGNRLRIQRTPAVHDDLSIAASVAFNGIDICPIAVKEDHHRGLLETVVGCGNRRKEITRFQDDPSERD